MTLHFMMSLSFVTRSKFELLHVDKFFRRSFDKLFYLDKKILFYYFILIKK